MMSETTTMKRPQAFLVLIRDTELSQAVAAALQDRLAEDGRRALALAPARIDTGLTGLARQQDLLQAAADWPTTQVVTLYEDGLLDLLKSLGLCAYVGVPADHEWRVLRWDDGAGAMLLPVSTARDLVDAVADYTPWHVHATAGRPLVSLSGKPRVVAVGPLARRLAVVGVATPLLTFGLPAALAAAQTAPASAAAGGTASSSLPAIPAPTTSPAQVNQWWQGLSQGQQQAVADASPAAIGALNGIPSAVRDYANRQVLPTLIDQTQGQILNLQNAMTQPTLDPNTGLAAIPDSVYQQQISALQTKLDGLQTLQQTIGQPGYTGFPTDTPTTPAAPTVFRLPDGSWDTAPVVQDNPATAKFLLGVDTDGLGHFIVASGNPDTAQNVVTLVPGMLTQLNPVSVQWHVEWADNILNQTTTDDPGRSTAVVTWYGPGYNAPQSVGAMTDSSAVAAAPYLQNFQAGLVATNTDPASMLMSLFAHSYGTTVVGEATQLPGGIYANDIAVFGSPGTDVRSAAQLTNGMIPPDPTAMITPQVFAGRTYWDIIGLTPGFDFNSTISQLLGGNGNLGPAGLGPTGLALGHGVDPTNPSFGATVVQTQDGTPGDLFNIWSLLGGTGGPDIAGFSRLAHSAYADPNGLAMLNMGLIAAGKWPDVTLQDPNAVPPAAPANRSDSAGGPAPAVPQLLQAPAPPVPSAINPDGTPVQGQAGTQSGPAAVSPTAGAINPDGTPVQGQAGTQSGAAVFSPNTSAVNPDGTPVQGQAGSPSGPAAFSPNTSAVNPDGTPVQGQAGSPSGPAAFSPNTSAVNPDGTPVQGQAGTQSGPAVTPPAPAANPDSTDAAPPAAPAAAPAPALAPVVGIPDIGGIPGVGGIPGTGFDTIGGIPGLPSLPDPTSTDIGGIGGVGGIPGTGFDTIGTTPGLPSIPSISTDTLGSPTDTLGSTDLTDPTATLGSTGDFTDPTDDLAGLDGLGGLGAVDVGD